MSREHVYTFEEVGEVGRLLSAKPSRLARATFVILLILVAAGMIWAAFARADQVAKARGLVRSSGELARIQSERAGKLVEVATQPGQNVRKGEILARLDESILQVEHQKIFRAIEAKRREVDEIATLRRIAMEEAASERRSSTADLEVTRASLAQQKTVEARRLEEKSAAELLARQDHDKALQEAKRGRYLAGDGLLARVELETLESELRNAKVRLESAERLAKPDPTPIDLATRRVEAAEESSRLAADRAQARLQELALRTATAEAALARLEKDREGLERDLDRCKVRAPMDGVVVDGKPQVGDVVDIGASLFLVAPGGELRFDAMIPNSEIAGIHVGQPARIKLDAYPYQQFGVIEGRIAYVAKDAKITGNDMGAAGGFYEVRIDLPPRRKGSGRALELGMAGHAEIIRSNERILVLAFRKLEDKVKL